MLWGSGILLCAVVLCAATTVAGQPMPQQFMRQQFMPGQQGHPPPQHRQGQYRRQRVPRGAMAGEPRHVAPEDIVDLAAMPLDDQIRILETRARQQVGLGDLAGAEMLLRKAIDLKPNDPYLQIGLAMAFAQAGQLQRAVPAFKRAIYLGPPNVHEVHYNLAYTYQNMGQYHDALQEFLRVTELQPTFRPAYVKAAWLAKELGHVDVAVASLQKAIELNPNDPNALMYLADTLNNRKRWTEAVELYRRAVNIDSRNPDLRLHLGDTLMNLGKVSSAMREYRRGLRFNSKQPELLAAYLQASQATCTWKRWDRYVHRCMTATRAVIASGSPSPLSPYHALSIRMPRALRRDIASSWSSSLVMQARVAGQSPHAPVVRKRGFHTMEGGVLRLGFISRRFERYPGTQLMLRLFGLINRTRFQVYCYASGADDGSEERATVQRDCDVFRDVSLSPASQTASLIARDRVHILVDYDGLHQFNNMATLALRPAPVQVSFLGFGGSTGRNDAVDMVVVDPSVAPCEHIQEEFGEKVLMLRGSYQPQDPFMMASVDSLDDDSGTTRPLFSAPASNAAGEVALDGTTTAAATDDEAGGAAGAAAATMPSAENGAGDSGNLGSTDARPSILASVQRRQLFRSTPAPAVIPDRTSVVFATFNRVSKFDPAAFRTWMRILLRVPGSVLVMYAGSDAAAEVVETRLRREAAAVGVAASRLVFVAKVGKVAHLARHAGVSLFLDSFQYGAHTTASDALFMGVPVLSMPGNHFASRVATGLSSALACRRCPSPCRPHHSASGLDNPLAAVPSSSRAFSLRDYENLAVSLVSSPLHPLPTPSPSASEPTADAAVAVAGARAARGAGAAGVTRAGAVTPHSPRLARLRHLIACGVCAAATASGVPRDAVPACMVATAGTCPHTPGAPDDDDNTAATRSVSHADTHTDTDIDNDAAHHDALPAGAPNASALPETYPAAYAPMRNTHRAARAPPATFDVAAFARGLEEALRVAWDVAGSSAIAQADVADSERRRAAAFEAAQDRVDGFGGRAQLTDAGSVRFRSSDMAAASTAASTASATTAATTRADDGDGATVDVDGSITTPESSGQEDVVFGEGSVRNSLRRYMPLHIVL